MSPKDSKPEGGYAVLGRFSVRSFLCGDDTDNIYLVICNFRGGGRGIPLIGGLVAVIDYRNCICNLFDWGWWSGICPLVMV